ncbi:TolC family protein [Leptospira sp. GIMC2001]|uniref:TolC family protein n=1 Tax=Leptospira sp. GIMC2001 TaxID=1513297 RepID=UPI00234943B5|nr:TolC family protein [Leptospira sp. GIMC2001]WCL47961.1 TolC family protein [Leptospira sp. GIMC2001]
MNLFYNRKASLAVPILSFSLLLSLPSNLNSDEFDEQIRRAAINELENPGLILPELTKQKKLNLTIDQAVQYVISNNLTVQNAKFEILKADSPELKNESKFIWKIVGGVTVFKQQLPQNNVNLFQGTKISQDRISAGIEKQFAQGTYFKVEGYTQRFDSSAFEGNNTPSSFSILAIPPLYTGGLSFTLSQELLKYSFGQSEENTKKILRNQTKLKRDEMINILTQLVVSVLIDYWSLSIYDSQVTTYENLLKNTQEIRSLTIRKQGLGLSENFEVNQWNSVLSKTESILEKAKIERLQKERDLVRILNVDTNSSISGLTDLNEKPPAKVNLEKDIDYAYSNRLDLITIRRSKEMAKLGLANAEEEEKPSVKASLTYGSIAQSVLGPQYNWSNPNQSAYAFLFPQLYAEMKIDYPLWNEETKAEIRAAEVDIADLDIAEKQLRDGIRDELKDRWNNIQSSYAVLQETKQTQVENQKYYNGLLSRFRQGRYNAVVVKTALDALVQTELAVTQAKINYNINLLRYDLAKNFIFEKYGVDIYRILAEVEKEAVKAGMPSSGSLFDESK